MTVVSAPLTIIWELLSRPGDKHGSVVVSDPVVWYGVPIAAPVLDGLLPFTEAVQRLSRMVIDL